MRKTITKVVLIICAVSVALGIALCASGVVMGADVEKALRGIGINVETRIEPNNMYDDYNDYNDDINDFFKEFGIDNMEGDYNGCGIVIVSCIRYRCACLYYCRNSNAGGVKLFVIDKLFVNMYNRSNMINSED